MIVAATPSPVVSRSVPSPAAAAPSAASTEDKVELSSPQTPLPKWTVLVYSAADNDLYSFMHKDIDEMEMAGSTPEMNIVAQIDHGGRKGAERMLVTQDSVQDVLNSPVEQKMGHTDMADPNTLADFIAWGMKNYPAENYMLVISDHGNGWRGACQDVSAGTWMDLPSIREGLEKARSQTHRKLDVIGFDACLMASAEVAHELKDEASYLVASQEVEGGDGWPYTRLLGPRSLQTLQAALSARLSMTPEQLSRHVVKTAEGARNDLPTMAAIDLSKAADITAAVDVFAQAIIDSPVSRGTLRSHARRTQRFTDYKDLYDFAERISKDNRCDQGLRDAASGVMNAVSNAVIEEQHSSSYPKAHGITIQLPSWRFSPPSAYGELKFADDTKWEEANLSMGKYWFWPWPI